MLEAGIEEPFAADVPAFAPLMQQSNIDWNYRTQPEKYSCRALPDMGCGWARGKVGPWFYDEFLSFHPFQHYAGLQSPDVALKRR